MIKELEDYIDEKLEAMARGMVACIRPEVIVSVNRLAKLRDPAGIVIQQDIDIVLTQLGLMAQEELIERREEMLKEDSQATTEETK